MSKLLSWRVSWKKRIRLSWRLRRQIKANPSIDFDDEMAKLYQQVSDLESRLADSQSNYKSLELIVNACSSKIDHLPTSTTLSLARSTRSRSLATCAFPTLMNPPTSLDDRVIEEWCKKVGFEIMQYFERKQKERFSQRINEYATKIQELERERYFLRKQIAGFQRENKNLRAAGRAFNRALKTQIDSIDNSDEIRKKERKLKELLCIAIRHTVDPPLTEDLDKEAQDL